MVTARELDSRLKQLVGDERKAAAARGEDLPERMTVEFSKSDFADVEDAVNKLREEWGRAVSLGEAIAELARRAQGAPVDRPGHQVIIHDCPKCQNATRVA